MIISFADKTKIFKNIFFLTSLKTDLINLKNYQYFNLINFDKIQTHEIINVIKESFANKAFETNDTSNKVLQLTLSVLMFLLHSLYNACWTIEHHSKLFQEFITVILWKLAKDDYTQSKSYRSITLLNTLEKTLKKIMTMRINWVTKQFNLLSKRHMRKCRAWETKHALQMLLKTIHAAWLRKKIVMMLLLNITEIFDNVLHTRLLHNLKKRRIDNNMTN